MTIMLKTLLEIRDENDLQSELNEGVSSKTEDRIKSELDEIKAKLKEADKLLAAFSKKHSKKDLNSFDDFVSDIDEALYNAIEATEVAVNMLDV